MHRLRLGALRIAVLLVSLGVSLALADAAFRLYERIHLLARMPEPGDVGAIDLGALNYNEGVVERSKAPGEFRVLSFGDSFGYSIMQPDRSYAGIVERELARARPDLDVRVINLAEPATSPRDYVAASRYWAEIFEYDAVLFHVYLGNDMIDAPFYDRTRDWRPIYGFGEHDRSIVDGRLRRIPHRFPLRMLDHLYALWRAEPPTPPPPGFNLAAASNLDERTFRQTLTAQMLNFDVDQLEPMREGYDEVVRLLRRAVELKQAGKGVAVALGPSEVQVRPEVFDWVVEQSALDAGRYDVFLPQRVIARIASRIAVGVPFFDITAAFQRRHAATGAPLYHRRNTHWDAEGNVLAGEVIASVLGEVWFGLAPSPHTATPGIPRPGGAHVSDDAIDLYVDGLLAAPDGAPGAGP